MLCACIRIVPLYVDVAFSCTLALLVVLVLLRVVEVYFSFVRDHHQLLPLVVAVKVTKANLGIRG